jgi:predicted ATPase
MRQRYPGPFLRKLSIRNYKSIAACQVSLKPLTVLVGRNGSGKSNFLDAIHFVTDALLTSLDHAFKSRGGIGDVRRRSTGHPINFAMKLEVALSDYRLATYGFEVAAREKGGFAIRSEQLDIRDAKNLSVAHFRRDEKIATASIHGRGIEVLPPVLADRLYLVTAAGLPAFRPAYDGLLAMGFYNLNPEAMKELQSPDAGEILHGDGSNIASVIARLTAEQPDTLQRIKTYLSTIIPGIENVERISLGPRETILFGQKVQGAQHPWRFYASSMSDGTLRALGALVAVTQFAGTDLPIQLVGLEEPETALHPAAAGALMEALREATPHTQVLVTSHSPDLLDQLDPDRDALLVVASENGNSRIAAPDTASVQAIRRHLYTPGEMLRMDQLQPDPLDAQRQEQADLFDDLPVFA